MHSIQSPQEEFFTLVSFEGPDGYSTCGGLAERVTRLAARLASHGFETHLFFLGAPGLPPNERIRSSRLTLHRWAQWLSASHPGGVLDGEWARLREMADSLPAFLCENLVRPALKAGFEPIIIAEEWQTAPTLIALGSELERLGVTGQARLVWRTGAVIGWDLIDWESLGQVAELGAIDAALTGALTARGIPARVLPAEPDALLGVLGSNRQGNGVRLRVTAPVKSVPVPAR